MSCLDILRMRLSKSVTAFGHSTTRSLAKSKRTFMNAFLRENDTESESDVQYVIYVDFECVRLYVGEPFNPMNLTCSPEQMELCLTRILRDIRQESGEAKPLDSSVVQSQGLEEMPENEEEEKDDPFSFLQQDLFENASLQECENEMKEKLGDEGFCFVIQVSDGMLSFFYF